MLDYHINKALEIDPREPKLPAWVREKLDMMRRAATEARTELAALKTGSEPSPFWLESWDDSTKRFYLPKDGGRLIFGSPINGGRLELSVNSNHGRAGDLCINSHSGGIAARPWAANVLTVNSAD